MYNNLFIKDDNLFKNLLITVVKQNLALVSFCVASVKTRARAKHVSHLCI